MDMSGMSMTMPMDSTSMGMATATTTAAAATSTAMSMGGMDMDMGGHDCKISMLWNWNTVDACFISKDWHVKSTGMFAGSCIGVILLALLLELLRRSVKEYDRYLVRKNAQNDSFVAVTRGNIDDSPKAPGHEAQDDAGLEGASTCCNPPAASSTHTTIASAGYRPKIHEQAIRALLHTAQFIVAYFLMLLAMYYNGYIIICIFIGAYIGSFVFQWEKLGSGQQTSAAGEATVCCG
ncbi:hypothetical protein M434DRAFT_394979 [Hypoxylon sp. CO27-5]|nr:hypothetical protein M434DRAFT_394979 [Hypoxylon sp. CO27-5]